MIEVKVQKSATVAFLHVDAGVRYWEDASINGVSDDDGSLIPFRDGESWRPVIDIEKGQIIGWPENTIAEIHYKVCDAGIYTLLDKARQQVVKIDGYVPAILSPGGDGYGDYIIMNVGPDGTIANWVSDDLDEFEDPDRVQGGEQ